MLIKENISPHYTVWLYRRKDYYEKIICIWD